LLRDLVAHRLAHARQQLRHRHLELLAEQFGPRRARPFGQLFGHLRHEARGDCVAVDQRFDAAHIVALRRVNQQRQSIRWSLLVALPPDIAADRDGEQHPEQHQTAGR
jgi:hypothetical protein